MADDGVLRDFLVALGFTVDVASQKRFHDSLRFSTEGVEKLGLAIGGVSTALVAGMQRITDQFESLYYTAQLTGTTVQSLRDLQFAAGQVGTSAEAMTQALRTAHVLLQSPGGETEIRAFTGYTGAITSSTQAVDILMRHWKTLYDNGQAWLARQQEQVLGFNSTALEPYILNLDRANAAVAEHARRWKAIDQQKLASDAVQLRNAWRSLSDEILYWPTLFTARFIGPLTTGVRWLTGEMETVRHEFEGLDRDTQNWILGIGGIAVAFGSWKAATVVIGGLARAFGLVKVEARGAAAAEREATAAASGMGRVGGLRGIISMFAAIEVGRAVSQATPQDVTPDSPAAKAKQREFWNRWFGWTGVHDNPQWPGLLSHLFHHSAYQPGAGGGLFHLASYTRGAQASGDLQEWLHGNSSFIPVVRVLSDSGEAAGAGADAGSEGAGPAPRGAGGAAKPFTMPYGAGAGGGNLGWAAAEKLIEHFESGGRNVMNYINDATHTAGGYFQITNTTWRRYAGAVPGASQYQSAISAPFPVQEAVAKAIFEHEGFAPWANYDKRLAAAIGGTRLGAGDTHHHHGNRTVVAHQGDVNVTVHAPGASPDHIGQAVAYRHSRVLGDAIRNLAPVLT